MTATTAAITGALANVAATLAVFAGVAVSLGVLAKTPAGRAMRWAWRRLVGQPLRSWVHDTVAEVADERVVKVLMTPNGGRSLADVSAAVHRVEARTARIEHHLGIDVLPPPPPEGVTP